MKLLALLVVTHLAAAWCGASLVGYVISRDIQSFIVRGRRQ